MNLCLITPGTATQWQDADLALSGAPARLSEFAPLGPLTLASLARAAGNTVRFIDTNALYFQYLREEKRESVSFAEFVLQRLREISTDLFGFSTICSSYPLTLRLCEGLRGAQPGVPIVLGGPQASVVDQETMRAFSSVDMIVRGEAELTFPLLLEQLNSGRDPSQVPGLTIRQGKNIRRTEPAALFSDLDSLPLPAYDLYADLDPTQPLALELGRGCPFGCTFCSTNDFFRRRFRLKSPAKVLAEMSLLSDCYKAPSFELVHDMFTVDRKRVVAFCETLLNSGKRFAWNCSARTDCVDEALLDLMRAAGCNGIFYGVESGSPRLQKIIDKRLDLEEARRNIEHSAAIGMKTTVSVIIGFPEEEREDLLQSVDIFTHASALDGGDPQLHLLAPLAGTPLQRKYETQLTLDDIFSDMSHQGWSQDPVDRVLIASHPEIFSNFYSMPSLLPRPLLNHLRNLLTFGRIHFRWLLVALTREFDFLDVAEQWLVWLGEERSPKTSFSAEYFYGSTQTATLFLAFVRRSLLPRHQNQEALEALIEYSEAFNKAEESIRRESVADSSTCGLLPEDRVTLDPSVSVLELKWDVGPLLAALRRGQPLPSPSRQKSVILLQFRDQKVNAWQQTALAAEILGAIDGSCMIRQQAARFSERTGLAEAASLKTHLVAMEQFLSRKWIRLQPPGARAGQAVHPHPQVA